MLSLLCLFSVLFASTVDFVFASDCKPPENADLKLGPEFWCSLKANISIRNECSTYVEETIVLPWSTGTFRRDISHQSNQRIYGISAIGEADGEETPLYVERISTSVATVTVLKIRPGESGEMTTVMLRYRVERGITTYTGCSIMNFPDNTAPEGKSTMLVKWAVGSTSIKNIKQLEAHFSLVKDSKNMYLDSPIQHPENFKPKTETITTDATKTVRVSHVGDSDGMPPGLFIFYFRFGLAYGWAECPNSRNCDEELQLIKEAKPEGLSHKLVIGLSVGGGLALLAVVVTVWTCCTKSQRRNDAQASLQGAAEASLPNSLRHFAYDTGDEHSSKKWQQWAEASPRTGKEIRAIELSPRNRK